MTNPPQTKTIGNESRAAEWETKLTGIINGTDVFFHKDAKDVMFEVACEVNGKCDVDQRSFKAYLCRCRC